LITLISNNHKTTIRRMQPITNQQKQSLISTWHTLNRSICIKDIHKRMSRPVHETQLAGQRSSAPMDIILKDHVNWLAVTYRNSIRNWRGKRPIMSSLQNVTEQASLRTKLAKRILSQ
jgi:hypothetical protein